MSSKIKKDEEKTVLKRSAGDTGREWGDSFPWIIRWLTGAVLTFNFVLFWAVPIFGQGNIWKLVLRRVCSIIFLFSPSPSPCDFYP